MRFSVREATSEDYEGLCEVHAEVETLHIEALPHIFRKPDGPAPTYEFISGIIADENAALFVAESDGQIVGLVHVSIREAPDVPIIVPRRYAWIHDLVVKKNCRRCGVGRSLAEKAHQWALEKGVSQVELTVWEFNEEAMAFYERIGYSTARRGMCKSLK